MPPSLFHRNPAPQAVEKTSVPSGFSADDDLDKVWAEVIARCNKITKWDLNEQRAVTVDQVLAQINPPKDKDGGREVKDTAKKVFKNALVCVQRFGSIVATAAGAVFGPSQQCFNAISFVITAVQDYDAVFGNITTLMERVSVFMDKLRIYLEDNEADVKLDKRLRFKVYKVLEHFLTILGLSHKLTKGWKGKVKLAIEIGAFGKDEGIKDAMAKLETLIADVYGQEISVIVKDLSEAARNIRGVDRKIDQIAEAQERTIASLGHLEVGQEKTNVTLGKLEAGQEKNAASMDHLEAGQEKTNTSLGHLESAEQRRKAAEDDEKRLKEIKDALGVDKQNWQDTQAELERKRVPGTGKWLLDFGTFSRWSAVEDEKPDSEKAPTLTPRVNALSLQADEGYGKSYLCSMVINHLQNKYREEQRIGLAYYYFQRDERDRRPEGATSSNTINSALKAIIYQLATARTSLGREYAKLIHKSCSANKNRFSKSTELWQTLVTDFSKTLEGTIFIVLDGVDETDGEPGRPLAAMIQEVMAREESLPLRIRMFFTGRPNSLRTLSIGDEVGIPEIKIAAEGDACLNEADIMLYAEERLQEIEFFKNENLAELRQDTKDILGRAVQGDYASLDLKLANISKSRSPRDVRRELEFANESRTAGIERSIGALNLTMDEEDIVELNHMLTFEAVCYGDQNVAIYEQYLKLVAESQSFDPLAKRIQDRYSTVFAIDDEDTVSLTTEDIRKYLREDEETGVQVYDSALQDGEVNMVKNLLRKHFEGMFGSDDIYEKFGFDEFFATKLMKARPEVDIGSLTECHIQTVKACLSAMCDHFSDTEEFSDLHSYAYKWFADHMMVVPPDFVDPLTLSEAGRRLLRLLWDTDFIDEWWNEERTSDFSRYWVYEFGCTDAVYDWMSHPTVHKSLIDMPTERRWVLSVTTEEGPKVRILEIVAKRMAERWFHSFEGTWFLSMGWLLGYISLLRGQVPTSMDASVEQIEEIEAWSKETLDNAECEGEWHFIVGKTFAERDFWKQAIDRFQQAVPFLPDDHNLTMWLTKALGNNSEFEKAVETWEGLIDKYEELTSKDDDFKSSFWSTMFCLIGPCKINLKAFDKSEERYRMLLHNEWNSQWRLVLALEESEQIKEAVETLEDLISANTERIDTDEELKQMYWGDMLYSLGRWSALLEDYEKAELSYRKVITECMERENFEEFAKKAVVMMTETLNKQEKYQECIEVLEDLENRTDPEVGTWLIALLHEYAANDDFHERISIAAIRAERFKTLVEKYRIAMRSARADGNWGTLFQLQYFLANLFWMHDTPSSRQTALEYWEDIMYQTLPDGVEDVNWVWFARIDSSKKLASAFFDFAKNAGLNPMTPEAEKYMARLKRVTECNPAIVRDRGNVNLQIPLARLHHLAGNETKAKDTIRDWLSRAFKATEEDDPETRRDGWYKIALAFNALDDEVNALAAWSHMNPIRPEDQINDAAENKDGEETDETDDDESPWEGCSDDEEEADENADADSDEETATGGVNEEEDDEEVEVEHDTEDTKEAEIEAGAEDEGKEDLPNGTTETNNIDPSATNNDNPTTNGETTTTNGETTTTEEEPSDPVEPPKLVGILGQQCDGRCGTEWSYAGEIPNISFCKDCIDVQFEPTCLAALRAGTLTRRVCNPLHEFTVYPPFDPDRWASTDSKEYIWVDGTCVPRKEWLDQVKKMYWVDEESLKARDRFLWSVRRIQRAWRLSRWIRRSCGKEGRGSGAGPRDLLLRCLI